VDVIAFSRPVWSVLGLLALLPAQPIQAGLLYSGERFAELPAQWRGFLTDLRMLRSAAVKPTEQLPASPLRHQYEEEVARLLDLEKRQPLSIDQKADLGALYLRLGLVQNALQTLREAQKEHSSHYAVMANLGTAWQMSGEIEQAIECLTAAVEFAPGRTQRAEQLHLRLMRLRQRDPKSETLDDLFSVQFVGDSGQFEPGKLREDERKKLPADSLANVQRLLLWLPFDGKLVWYLAELANAHGDLEAANELYEMCVGQFGLNALSLRNHRAAVRIQLAEFVKKPTAKAEHEAHTSKIPYKSRRPLLAKEIDLASLPPIRKDAVNQVPWGVFLETRIGTGGKPAFPRYLQELNDQRVSLAGFIQPLTDDGDLTAFMFIEYPTGCWYCEMPDLSGIVLVEMAENKTLQPTRQVVKITGRLLLNDSDPENFLYTLKEASVGVVD
jgi:hypothetical protein